MSASPRPSFDAGTGGTSLPRHAPHTPHHHTAPAPAPILRAPRSSSRIRHPGSRTASPTRDGASVASVATGGTASSIASSSEAPSRVSTPAHGSGAGTPATATANSAAAVGGGGGVEPSVTFSSLPGTSSPLAPSRIPSPGPSNQPAAAAAATQQHQSHHIGLPSLLKPKSSRPSSSGSSSSVPPPTLIPLDQTHWERKVGFDTMPDAEDTNSREFSFTLQCKSRGYRRTKNTRTFMCAIDENNYSERALEWLMESLVEDGDEVVAMRVLEGEAEEIDQEQAREEARELLETIVELNEDYDDRRISIVVEFIAGRSVTSTLVRMIHVYRPDSLTVGTRGKSMNTLQKMLGGATMGSCSREILSRSPVPVVVVRPEAKVRKHRKKRAADPKRRSYHDLVAKSTTEALPLSRERSQDAPHPAAGPLTLPSSSSAGSLTAASASSRPASVGHGTPGFKPVDEVLAAGECGVLGENEVGGGKEKERETKVHLNLGRFQ